MDFGLGRAVELRKIRIPPDKLISKQNRLLELTEVLDQQFDPVEVRGREFGVGVNRAAVTPASSGSVLWAVIRVVKRCFPSSGGY